MLCMCRTSRIWLLRKQRSRNVKLLRQRKAASPRSRSLTHSNSERKVTCLWGEKPAEQSSPIFSVTSCGALLVLPCDVKRKCSFSRFCFKRCDHQEACALISMAEQLALQMYLRDCSCCSICILQIAICALDWEAFAT